MTKKYKLIEVCAFAVSAVVHLIFAVLLFGIPTFPKAAKLAEPIQANQEFPPLFE